MDQSSFRFISFRQIDRRSCLTAHSPLTLCPRSSIRPHPTTLNPTRSARVSAPRRFPRRNRIAFFSALVFLGSLGHLPPLWFTLPLCRSSRSRLTRARACCILASATLLPTRRLISFRTAAPTTTLRTLLCLCLVILPLRRLSRRIRLSLRSCRCSTLCRSRRTCRRRLRRRCRRRHVSRRV